MWRIFAYAVMCGGLLTVLTLMVRNIPELHRLRLEWRRRLRSGTGRFAIG
jgi:hypothetical protein